MTKMNQPCRVCGETMSEYEEGAGICDECKPNEKPLSDEEKAAILAAYQPRPRRRAKKKRR